MAQTRDDARRPAEPDDDPAVGQERRARLIDVNDGLIASAGMVEGVAQAHASSSVILVTGIATVLVGVAAVAGIRYAEASDERDAHEALVAAERRRITVDPEAELAELASIYEAKGLDAALARQVAEQLSADDPLAAQLDAEYRLDELGPSVPPLRAAALTAGAFVGGAAVPLVVAALAPASVRVALTLVTVVVALVVSATLAARSGHVPVPRAIVRTVSIGLATMLITIAAGSLLDLSSAEVDLDLDL
ncbi:VIT1/CCC1 transporter family protein [Cellulomonas sp. HZM]|uniref:VIT1/CCC1 transporter family protein n=1 Tax=Cellulomonas sp. HZM TaxID=1454010 RepID=UPI00068AE903|nr:VIT1/CCC1 transporter family protein [Cellulomonas sp. HZM]